MSCSCGGNKNPVRFDIVYKLDERTYGVIDIVTMSNQVVFVCVDYLTGGVELIPSSDVVVMLDVIKVRV